MLSQMAGQDRRIVDFFRDRLIDVRNHRMAERAEPLLAKGRAFQADYFSGAEYGQDPGDQRNMVYAAAGAWFGRAANPDFQSVVYEMPGKT